MLINKLENKLRFIKIPNLMFIIVVVSAFVYIFDSFNVAQNGRFFLEKLLFFDKHLILRGQVWRALTFIFLPFKSSTLIFAVLEAYFLYFLGTSLEVSLGESRFSLFYIFGVLGCLVVGFFTGYTTIYFLNLSMFLVFASLNPSRKVLLFYVIPVKTFYIGVIDTIYFMFVIVVGFLQKDFPKAFTAIAAIINFLLFFGPGFFIDMFNQIKDLQEKSKRMYRNGRYWGN